MGSYISRATCGRIMAITRRVYGLGKPLGTEQIPKDVPFRASRRHQFCSTDIRYIDHPLPDVGNVYSVTIMDNDSRALLWRHKHPSGLAHFPLGALQSC